MSVTKEFIRKWRAWRQTSYFDFNAHHLDNSIVIEKIKSDLSHMESYLYSIGIDAIEGKAYDYFKIASQELLDLEKLCLELESCYIAERKKEIYRNHIEIIRALWLEIQKFDLGEKAI